MEKPQAKTYLTLTGIVKHFVCIIDLEQIMNERCSRVDAWIRVTFRNSSPAISFCSGGTRSGWVCSARFL